MLGADIEAQQGAIAYVRPKIKGFCHKIGQFWPFYGGFEAALLDSWGPGAPIFGQKVVWWGVYVAPRHFVLAKTDLVLE